MNEKRSFRGRDNSACKTDNKILQDNRREDASYWIIRIEVYRIIIIMNWSISNYRVDSRPSSPLVISPFNSLASFDNSWKLSTGL